MADVKICDRCGKKIGKSSWPLRVEPYRYLFGIESGLYVFKYDLCAKCAEDFTVHFMSGPSEGSTDESK